MVMDIKEIMETIPHRQPFLLIDRIEELEPVKNVSPTMSHFLMDIFRRNR